MGRKKVAERANSPLSLEESAIQLKKAFNKAGFSSLKQLAEKLGMNYSTIKHYFEGHYLPPTKVRDLILRVLDESSHGVGSESEPRSERPTQKALQAFGDFVEAKRRAQLLQCAMMLAMDHLRYFRDASEAERGVLKAAIQGKEVGHFTSLFGSLYDEEHLKAWKAFSE